MQKVTLKHIGAVSLGRLLAIWSFVFGLICLILWAVVSLLIGLLGVAAGGDIGQIVVGLGITLVLGVVGLVVMGIVMFIVGVVTATIYNIILGIGGGIDLDFDDRAK